MRFEWDEQKNKNNIAKHGIDFADAPRIFLTPILAALDERFDYGEDRWVALGLLDGRIVNIVYTEPEEETRRVISLRKALQHEKSNTNSSSKTNWERLDALTDADIDTSDSPPLTEEFFAKAQWILPGERFPRPKVKVELELDPMLLAWFQSQGQDYQTRMRAALRLYAEAHQSSV